MFGMTAEQIEVEMLEEAYDAMRSIPDHRWGQEQNEESAQIAAALRVAYDKAGTDEMDRIAL